MHVDDRTQPYDCYTGMQEEAFYGISVDSSGSAMVPEPIHSP